jgi:hypothetical protein
MRGNAQVVVFPVEQVAEIEQAEYFLALLDRQKATACKRLEAHLDAAASQGDGDECARRRRRRAVDALKSEIGMIDRMRHALRVRLGLPTLTRPTDIATRH